MVPFGRYGIRLRQTEEEKRADTNKKWALILCKIQQRTNESSHSADMVELDSDKRTKTNKLKI